MKQTVRTMAVFAVLFGAARSGLAYEAHDHGNAATTNSAESPDASTAEQVLTGEVMDVICYLSHGSEGQGPKHAGCAKKCIKSGLPVAIKVGGQLYLATMATHEPANAVLADFAGQRVTVHGHVMEADGQHLIAVTKVEQAN